MQESLLFQPLRKPCLTGEYGLARILSADTLVGSPEGQAVPGCHHVLTLPDKASPAATKYTHVTCTTPV